MKKTLIILILGLIFISGCIQITKSNEEQVKEVVDNLFFYMIHADYEKAYDLIYSKEGINVTKEDFTKIMEEDNAFDNIVNYSIDRVELKNDMGSVYVTEINNLGSKASETIKVILIDKKWKIDASDVSLEKSQNNKDEIKTSTPSLSDNQYIETIKNNLIKEGISIKSVEIVNGRDKGSPKSLFVAYDSKSSDITDTRLGGEIGSILDVFLDTTKEGFDIDALMGLFGMNGEYGGSWYLSKEVKEDFLNGKVTIDELVVKVFNTIEKSTL